MNKLKISLVLAGLLLTSLTVLAIGSGETRCKRYNCIGECVEWSVCTRTNSFDECVEWS